VTLDYLGDAMKISQYPDPTQIAQLLANDTGGPVVMVNLVKFKPQADGMDAGVSGAEAYMRYGALMRKFVEAKGGRMLYSGRVDRQLIGVSDVEFDVVALMEYPSRKAFVEIVSAPEVREFGKHRTAGLEGQWLIATTQT